MPAPTVVTDTPSPDLSTPPEESRVGWLEERLELRALYMKYGRKVFPVHPTFFLGEIAAFSFLILVITGIYLGLIYTPSNVDIDVAGQRLPQAYASVLLIESIPVANLFRTVHHWAAHVMVAAVILHALRVEACVVPARKRGTPESPEEPSVVAPLLTANYIMLGPGSPSYAVRQLAESLAWRTVLARHRLGAALVLASAATIAAGAFAIPVYEIYKVGQDLHWQPGLDLLGSFGWRVTMVAHWNNREGGAELDTSHAYIGRERFAQLQAMLPSEVDVLGIDEHTAVVLNFALGTAKVFGSGGMIWLHGGRVLRFDAGASVPLETFGLRQQPAGSEDIPTDVWDSVRQAHEQIAVPAPAEPTALIHALVSERGRARACADWARADGLRRELASAGWEVRDTPDGPILTRI